MNAPVHASELRLSTDVTSGHPIGLPPSAPVDRLPGKSDVRQEWQAGEKLRSVKAGMARNLKRNVTLLPCFFPFCCSCARRYPVIEGPS